MTKFYTGKPCKKHGVVERYVKTRGCVECRKDASQATKKRLDAEPEFRAARNAYARAWKKKMHATCTKFRDKVRARTKVWAKANPAKVRQYNLNKYNLTAADYDALLAAQHGACRICRRRSPGADKTRFYIDHDHSCCPGRGSCGKCIRGLLCQSCNNGLGQFRDNVRLLTRAAAYIALRRFIAS